MNGGLVTRLPLVADAQRERVVETLEKLVARAKAGEIEDVSVNDGVLELGLLEMMLGRR